MSSLISPTSSLFLPLSQLIPHCNRLLNSLHDSTINQKERVLFEQTLWTEVKKIRALNEPSIYLYLIGYYHTVLYLVTKLSAQNDLFQYHVLIRLGDLNRYTQRIDVAEYYYCNARNLFPYFGHAYNQLGLLTKPTNCYKCCYYYARAARSSDKPLNNIADSNLRIAAIKYDCEILMHILEVESCSSASNQTDRKKLPETVFEWFYVIVVAIYADNIEPITKLFLTYMNENFSTQRITTKSESVKTTNIYCDRESYIMLACLDTILDWLRLGTQSKLICPTINNELRQIRASLQTIIEYCGVPSLNTLSNNSSNATSTNTVVDSSFGSNNLSRQSVANKSNSSNSTMQDLTCTSTEETSKSSSSQSNKLPALPHDYVLRGFSPLDSAHRELFFKMRVRAKGSFEDFSIIDSSDNSQCFIDTSQLIQIISRIRSKMDAFGPLLIKRKTRNIALESILLHMDRSGDS